jgi:V8-like Glu-specific endopeptidase
MRQILFFIAFIVLLANNASAEGIRKVESAPGGKTPKDLATGAVAGGGSPEQITQAQLDADNQRASQHIKSYEQFARENSGSPVLSAARAEVQIIPKCAVAQTANGYAIGFGRPQFCPGHPLSVRGDPTLPEGGTPMAPAPSKEGCGGFRACSGVLAQNATTIMTAGHCTEGRSAKDFCDQFVFVFNRVGSKTNFSKDEVFGCDQGAVTDQTRGVANYNTLSPTGLQDHAAFRLTRAVPTATAEPLQWRPSTSLPTASETLYAVGHPTGAPRMISPITSPSRLGGSQYSYVQGNGYVYGGNSGGPLIDAQGRLTGILAAVDDTGPAGGPEKREPLVRSPDNKFCKTQRASGTVRIESVGASAQLSEAFQSVQSTIAEEPSVAPESPPSER